MLYAVIAIIVVLVLYIVLTINKLIQLKNNVNEAFSTMDVYLKKRWDLIPSLVETVKGYASFENSTLKEVVELRNKSYDDMSDNDKINANNKISDRVSKIMAIAESYPDLKASDNFINLSKDLTQVENEIANSRKYYNANVREYNNKVEMFPSNIVAKLFGYKTKNMFEALKEEKENIKVEL